MVCCQIIPRRLVLNVNVNIGESLYELLTKTIHYKIVSFKFSERISYNICLDSPPEQFFFDIINLLTFP